MNAMPFALLGFGFLSGMKHAFDADHVAAISTIVAKHNLKKSSLLGIFWGFGHTITLLIAGLIVLLFKISIPEKVSLSLEFIVGVMLVSLGINVLITINKNKIHLHKHKHGKGEHIHFHSHKLSKNHEHLHQSFFIGLIHGLAGSAALTLLILATIKSLFIGIIYILIFGIGSIAGMIIVSSIIASSFKLMPSKFEKAQKMLSISIGLISAIIGLAIIYDVGFVKGLLT